MERLTERRYLQTGLGWAAVAVVLIFCPPRVDSFAQRGHAGGATDVVLLKGRQHRVDSKLAEKAHNIGADESDSCCRREFVNKAAASCLFLSSLICGSEAAQAAPDVASATSATTPSIAGGELAVSEPPPNRATIVVGDNGDKSNVPTTRAQPAKGKNDSINKASDPRFFIAGGASAAISHGYTCPIDVVKTKIQIEPELEGLSLREATKKIIEEEGPGELLVGLGPTVIGYGIEGALKFGLYESLKPFFIGIFPANVDPAEPYLAAAVCAGAVASLVLCPMEETRIRLLSDEDFASGLLDGLPRLLKEDGILSPFKGLPPMFSKQIPYTAAKQVSFDVVAGAMYSALGVYAENFAFGVEVASAFSSSVGACVMSHPGDVLLTASYQRKENGSGGFFATVSNIYDKGGGFKAFFRGLNARFVHVGFIITSQLVIYDQIKQALGLAASGSS